MKTDLRYLKLCHFIVKMDIDFMCELRYAREDSLKHLTSFIDNPKVYTIENFKALTPRSFLNIFDGYNRSQDTILLSTETVYDEIKRLEKMMTKSDDSSIMAKLKDYTSFMISPIDYILSVPLDMGIKNVDVNLTEEQINSQNKKNRIKTVASTVPGLCLIAGAAYNYLNGDVETASLLYVLGGVYLISDLATYGNYMFGNTIKYDFILTKKEADNIFNEIKDCKVVLDD